MFDLDIECRPLQHMEELLPIGAPHHKPPDFLSMPAYAQVLAKSVPVFTVRLHLHSADFLVRRNQFVANLGGHLHGHIGFFYR